jgi:hypothetical protein
MRSRTSGQPRLTGGAPSAASCASCTSEILGANGLLGEAFHHFDGVSASTSAPYFYPHPIDFLPLTF